MSDPWDSPIEGLPDSVGQEIGRIVSGLFSTAFSPQESRPLLDGKWTVRKYHKAKVATIWNVFRPDGSWDGSFESFPEALKWATDPFERMSYWLDNIGDES